ncbi:MAG: hypothetical protein COV47_05195 [Candidatus Diapherotrites archaeon CG11_big_fil_rev_8_21_14_0_20_37_9]|nr:MAG: hypothetical protein COV47_05195 [Candidatus Diapherotrites archaeon CG11_big_fil_rev_8_21_14_0_20_37_9]
MAELSIDALEANFDSWVALVINKKDDYPNPEFDILKDLANAKGLSGVYLTVNKPYSSLKKNFVKGKINFDNLYFVDLVSRRVLKGKEDKLADCTFIDSPSSLTTAAIAFVQAIKMPQSKSKEKKVFIMADSLNTFMIYNKANVVKRFFHFLILKSRELGCKCILLSADLSDASEINGLVANFSDKVITSGGSVA